MGSGTWKTIGTGGGWPGDQNLVPVIEDHLREGRRVFHRHRSTLVVAVRMATRRDSGDCSSAESFPVSQSDGHTLRTKAAVGSERK